jgi:hypothetical protein
MSSIESVDLPREVPNFAFWHPDEFDPGVLRSISLYDFVSSISRTIADDHPFRWS